MTTPHRDLRILVLSASARTGSLNTRLAESTARAIAHTGAEVRLVNLRDFPVPLYDGDLQERDGVPGGAVRLGELLRETDGFVIASPEYNFSVPGTLKNLVDWVSRIKPWPFTGRNGLLVSASPSVIGGYRGLAALRVPLEALGARLYPEMFSLPTADGAFTADGELTEPERAQRLTAAVGGFLDVVEATVHYPHLRDGVAA